MLINRNKLYLHAREGVSHMNKINDAMYADVVVVCRSITALSLYLIGTCIGFVSENSHTRSVKE